MRTNVMVNSRICDTLALLVLCKRMNGEKETIRSLVDKAVDEQRDFFEQLEIKSVNGEKRCVAVGVEQVNAIKEANVGSIAGVVTACVLQFVRKAERGSAKFKKLVEVLRS